MSSHHWPSAQDADSKTSQLLDISAGASSTIFVRNLSFDVDDKQLAAYFDCGPVKRAFTLKDKNTDASRGVGFVEFAFAQDAKAAVERYHGKSWLGRPVQVELALQQSSDPVQRQKQKDQHLKDQQKIKEQQQKEQRKLYREEQKKKEQEKVEETAKSYSKSTPSHSPKTETQSQPQQPQQRQQQQQQQQPQQLGCILLLDHLDKEVEESELSNKAKKFGNVVQVLFPSPESTPATKTRPESLAARITFDNYKSAKAAMDGFEGRSFGANRVKPKMKLLAAGASDKISRLIVRNLPFSANEGSLKQLFGAHGHLTEVHLPLSDAGKMRGFAFVQFQNYDDAVKAIAAINGTKIGSRPVAVDFTLPKAKFDYQAKINQEHVAMKAEEEATLAAMAQLDDSDDDSDSDSDSDDDIKKEIVSRNPNELVSLGAVKKESKSEDIEAELEREFTAGMEDDDGDDDGESELVYTSTGQSDDEEQDEDDEDEDNEDEDDEDEDEDKKKDQDKEKKIKRDSDVGQGRTVFIRNLSYDTTEDSLYNKFSQYGRIMMVKICRDNVLNRSLGTAFVKFHERAVVDNLISNHAGEKLDKKEAQRRKMSYNNLLSDSSVRLDGRDLIISLAVDKKEATKLREEGQSKKKDKRNLYLAKEGVILPETSAAEGVSSTDMEKRQRGWTEKKKKLRNPNFSVSTTRLSVRNIPFDLTDKELRQLVLEKTKEQLKTDGKKIGSVAIKQIKIERDGKRLDKNGIPKSRGYGFVEFRDPDHSLTCLRLLNNNPTIWTPKARPIVEFALEDARKLLVHRKRFDRAASKQDKANSVQRSAEEAALAMLTGKSTGGAEKKEQAAKELVTMFKRGGKTEPSGPQKRDRQFGNKNNNDRSQGRKDGFKKQRK